MGRLVHELLRRTVDHLELEPGFTAAARHEIEEALAIASTYVTLALRKVRGLRKQVTGVQEDVMAGKLIDELNVAGYEIVKKESTAAGFTFKAPAGSDGG
jgi:hypothetical protein